MKRLAIFSLFLVFLMSCGQPIDPCLKHNEISPQPCPPVEAQSEFLFAFIGIILALGITNLIKGFDVLIKRASKTWWQELTNINKPSRWQLRLFWGISLTLLIFQLVWGMRLVLDKATNLLYFSHYVILAGLVYSMVVYIFPENIDSVFAKEEKEKSQTFWTVSIARRLNKLYFIYVVYLLGTVPVSLIFYSDLHGGWKELHWRDGNLIGILLKTFIGLLFFYAWNQKRHFIKTMKDGERVIFPLDYLLILASISIHFFYLWIRTRYLW